MVSANQAARVALGLLDYDTLTPLGTLPVSPGLCTGRAGGAGWGHHPPASSADLRDAFPLVVHGTPVKLLPVVIPVPHFVEQGHGAVLVLYDVTAFAKLDELRMELIAVASHELKTPLTTLQRLKHRLPTGPPHALSIHRKSCPSLRSRASYSVPIAGARTCRVWSPARALPRVGGLAAHSGMHEMHGTGCESMPWTFSTLPSLD